MLVTVTIGGGSVSKMAAAAAVAAHSSTAGMPNKNKALIKLSSIGPCVLNGAYRKMLSIVIRYCQ